MNTKHSTQPTPLLNILSLKQHSVTKTINTEGERINHRTNHHPSTTKTPPLLWYKYCRYFLISLLLVTSLFSLVSIDKAVKKEIEHNHFNPHKPDVPHAKIDKRYVCAGELEKKSSSRDSTRLKRLMETLDKKITCVWGDSLMGNLAMTLNYHFETFRFESNFTGEIHLSNSYFLFKEIYPNGKQVLYQKLATIDLREIKINFKLNPKCDFLIMNSALHWAAPTVGRIIELSGANHTIDQAGMSKAYTDSFRDLLLDPDIRNRIPNLKPDALIFWASNPVSHRKSSVTNNKCLQYGGKQSVPDLFFINELRPPVRFLNVSVLAVNNGDAHPGSVNNIDPSKVDCLHWCVPNSVPLEQAMLFADTVRSIREAEIKK